MVAASTHAEISTRMITQPPTAAAANENDEKATVALLANPNTPLSERDPEAAAAQDAFARHPLTGAFTEPAVEAAFAVGFFRDAFPLHALLFTAGAIVYLFTLFGSAWRDDVLLLIISLVSLIGRVRLHRMQDQVRSQWLGSWLWTGSVVLGVALDVSDYVNDSDRTCTAVRKLGVYVFPLLYLALALVNGSHGLGFLHKGALLLFLVVTLIMLYGSCGELALALSMGGALAVGYIVAHLVELRMRRAFAEKRCAEEEKRRAEEEKRHAEEERRRAEEERRCAKERQEHAETRREQAETRAERLQYDYNMLSNSRRQTADDLSDVGRGLRSRTVGPSPSQPHQCSSSGSSSSLGGGSHAELLRPPVPPSVAPSEANTADLEVAMQQMGIAGFVQAMQQQSAHEHQQVAHPALSASRPMSWRHLLMPLHPSPLSLSTRRRARWCTWNSSWGRRSASSSTSQRLALRAARARCDTMLYAPCTRPVSSFKAA